MTEPASLQIVKYYGQDPFLILISCLLSLRTRDQQMLMASHALFKIAKTPYEIFSLPNSQIEQIIYSVGSYKKKTLLLKSVSNELITKFNGLVPNQKEALLNINGIGPKTANLVLGIAFNIPALCVDVHVHRIANFLKLVKTKNTYDTEIQLCKIIPKEYWIEINTLFVMLGQNIFTSHNIQNKSFLINNKYLKKITRIIG